MFEKITEAEINERSMANVSTTPNRPTAFGESKMDAQALKLRFDRLSRYLAGRINEIFAGMSDGNLAKNVKIVEEKGEETIEYSLAEFILKMIEGDLTQINVKVPEGTQRLDVICNQVLRWQNEIKTGDFSDETVVVQGVTIRQFYEEFKKLEETGQGKPGEPGKSAYDYAVEGGYQGTEEEFAKKLATEYPSKVSQLENDEKYITASGAPVQTVNGKAGNVSLSAADVGARPNTWTPTAYEVGAEPVNTVNTHNASDQAHNDIRIELRNLANKINDLLDSDDENLNELHEIVEYIKNNHTLISNITTSKVSVADIVNDLVTSLPNKPLSAAQGVALKALIDAITVPTKLSQLENDKGYITGYTESDPTVPEWAKATKKPGYTKEEIGLPNVDNVKQYSASNPPPYPVKSVNNKSGNVTITAGDVGARPDTWTPTAADVGAEKSGNVAAHNTNTAAHNDIRLLIEGLSNRINAIFDSEDTDLDELSEIVAYIKSNKDLIDAITTSKVSISDIIDNLETSDSKKPLSAKQGVVLKALIDAITIPTKLSQLENDKKFITKSEAPVQTVNKKTGNVELNAEDVGARPDTWTPTASEVGARPDDWMPTAADVGARPEDWMPTASEVGARPATWMPSYSDVGAEKAGNVNTHNTNGAAHNDIRILIQGLTDRINAVLDSDDKTLDELSEIVAYIKANKTLIESVTTSKVNVSDIIDNLETPDPTKPLSAAQGVNIMVLLQQLVTEFGEALEAKANKEQGVFFIKGASGTAGTWTGTHPDITAYYDGLMIAYKVGVAGASTTTLNINSLGAVKVVKNNNTGISTSFVVNSVLFLVYTVDGSTAYWKAHDYDSNTRNSVGDYQKNNTKLYFVGTTTTDDATSSSYATSYTNSKVYVDANNAFNAESGFKGNLTGNADSATKATQDGNGNVIADTYATKTDIDDLKAELGIGDGYTNWIKKSVSTLGGSEIYGEDYNGDGKPDGYLKNTRMNSSGVITSASGMCLTGIIPVKTGDTIRIKNVTIEGTQSPYLCVYTLEGVAVVRNVTVLGSPDANGVYTIVIGSESQTSNISAIRLSVGVVDETSILTVNEEIVGGENSGGSSDDKDTDDGVPTYIVEEAKRVANAVQATRTAKTLVFTAMSDAHLYDGNSSHDKSLVSAKMGCAGIEEMRKRMHIDFVSYLGDYTWSSTTYTTEQVKKDITAFKETTDTTNTEIWCVGNHDVNYGSGRDRVMTADEIYSYVGANADGVKPFEDIHRCYGYLDFENQKIRVIYLNTCDTSDLPNTAGTAAPSEGMSINQIRWVAETALDFSDKEDASEWGVIVMGHHPLQYLVPTNRVLKILEAYKDGTEVVTTVTINNVTHTISYDFSNLDKRAEIICNVHGHSHNFASSKISSSSSITPWLWRFCIPNLGVGRENECATNPSADFANMYGHFDASGNPIYHTKTTGTAEETSFCVVAVDRKNKYIYAYKFGSGEDRTFKYGEGSVATTYTITVSASNCSGSNNPTTIVEGATATLKFTANANYELPTIVTVTGASHTWDKASGTLVLSNPTANVSVTITAIAKPTYVNLVKQAEEASSTAIYNSGKGYKNGVRLSSGSPFESANSSYVITGFIPFDATNTNPFYIKGVDFVQGDSNCRLYLFTSKTTLHTINMDASVTAANQNNFSTNFEIEKLGDKYYKFTRKKKDSYDAIRYYNGDTAKYVRWSLKGSGENFIISLGDPIE